MSKNSIIFIILLIGSACSTTKNVPKNDTLFIGHTIIVQPVSDSMRVKIKEVKNELSSTIKNKPNSKILGIPYKLLVFNMIDSPKGKGLGNWLKYKVGEPPVLGSNVDLDRNKEIMENWLENSGYFKSEVEIDTTIKDSKLKVVYTAKLMPVYKIRNVQFQMDTSVVFGKEVQAVSKLSLLKSGDNYNLNVIKSERVRIDLALKERGLYFFNPEFLIMDVDSAIGNHQVDIYCRLKKETPLKAIRPYRINEIIVFANYNTDTDTSIQLVKQGINLYQGYQIYDPFKKLKPAVFGRVFGFKPGDIYSREMHNQSLSRLVNLNVYKFVKARFQETDTTKVPSLNAFYYLTPAIDKSLRFEVSALTKSNNSAGTELSLTWRHRNFLKGAEQFSVKIYGGFERQVYSQQPTVKTNQFGLELNLITPKLISPINFKRKSSFMPQTKSSLGYEYFERNTQYTLNSAKISFGYIWKHDLKQENRLELMTINLVQPTYISPEYQLLLDTNITLARSIEKQLIIGPSYHYNYNSQIQPNNRVNNYFVNGNIELSGNLLGLVSGANVTKGQQKHLLGIPFSQYVRTELELRHYLKLGKKQTLASRIIGGLGYAYGNNTVMPFVKAFFAGGSNDLRAFRARSLGPGSYYAGNAATSTSLLPDQPGDIKLALSTEWRMKLFSVLYGALFIDAGNIWALNEDSTRPGAKFSNKFLKEFAVGAGAGLRIDVSFFVLRFDFAIPIRKPFLPEGSRWVLNKIDFGNSDWLKQNLVFNLAIGYPF